MSSPLKTLIGSLERQGVVVERGGRHIKLVHKGRLIGVLPHDLRIDSAPALRNTKSQCRRAGLSV